MTGDRITRRQAKTLWSFCKCGNKQFGWFKAGPEIITKQEATSLIALWFEYITAPSDSDSSFRKKLETAMKTYIPDFVVLTKPEDRRAEPNQKEVDDVVVEDVHAKKEEHAKKKKFPKPKTGAEGEDWDVDLVNDSVEEVE